MGRLQGFKGCGLISAVGILVILPILTQVYAEESSLTGPSSDVASSSSNKPNVGRFSRLLKANAGALQFTSISNAAPPLSGLSAKEPAVKQKSHKKKAHHQSGTINPTVLGRRTLDYDDTENFYENGEPIPRIITQPQPGNEYVYIRQGGIQTEEQQAAAASVTSINKQSVSNRTPLTLLRQTNGKRVNISPIFARQQQNEFHVDVNGDEEETKTTVGSETEDDGRVETTIAPLAEDNNNEQEEPQMIVNVVTSAPRSESDGQTNSPIQETKDSFVNPTPFITTETPVVPTTVKINATTSPSSASYDTKENLVVQSTKRIGSFPDFEDSPASLQTSESSSQPARVNVRPSESGKELEYEYVYYYYDDDEEGNGTANAGGKGHNKGEGGNKGAGDASNKAASPSTASTTSTTTPLPVEEADFDDEDEDSKFPDAPEVAESPKTTAATAAPVRTTSALPEESKTPVKPSNDNSNIVNQLDRSRGPKSIAQAKEVLPEADYKIEQGGDFDAGYEDEYEDEVIQVKAKGQPQRGPSSEEDTVEDEQEVPAASVSTPVPSTLAPAVPSTASQYEGMSTMAKAHPDSVNSPIILKQAGILQSVPASRLHPSTTEATTTTTEAPSSSTRPSGSRFRGPQRIRGNVTPREQVSTAAPEQQEEEIVSAKPAIPQRTPNRRIPTRRPPTEATSATPEAPASHVPVRTRFPHRTTAHPTSSQSPSTTTTKVTSAPSTEATTAEEEPAVRLSEAPQSENYVRSSTLRSPSSSGEQSTDVSSSEVTTIPADHSYSGEQQYVSHAAPVTTTTTTSTTTTTTEAPSTEGAVKTRTRFGGRPRRPLGSGASSASSTPAPEEASSTTARTPSRGRFGGRRSSTTSSSTDVEQPASSTAAPEAPKARIPSRNRFASRNRTPSTDSQTKTEAPVEKVETSTNEITAPSAPSASSPALRRKPGIFNQGRRRTPIASSTAATPAESADESSAAPSEAPSSTAAPVKQEEERKTRPGLPQIQRRRPGGVAPPGIRRGRLGASSTTEIPPSAPEENAISEKTDSEQSPTIQSEQVEVPSPSNAPQATLPGGRPIIGGGRLRTRPNKLVTTTTTVAPEPVNRERPSRLNGILNRRKQAGLPGQTTTTTASPAKEEAKDEESHDNAQEQVDPQHKAFVVQVSSSSSVTETEDTKEHTGEEAVEAPSSTTPGSILNRLKSQRKPGSIFRKRTDHHGE